jgi:probable phosphoglycerate mutase
MSASLPVVYLASHGETAWSLSGQDTGRTDLPLTERGERNGHRLAERLSGLPFARGFTSPLQLAALTCELAGLGLGAGRYFLLSTASVSALGTNTTCPSR